MCIISIVSQSTKPGTVEPRVLQQVAASELSRGSTRSKDIKEKRIEVVRRPGSTPCPY